MAAEITLYDISTDPPTVTTLVAATAAEIPAGAIVLYTDGTGTPKAMTMAQVKAFVSPSPAGQLVATATYAVGTYPAQGSPNRIFPPWVLDSDAPTGVTLETPGSFTNARLVLGVPTRLADRQFGWLFTCKLDGTVFGEQTGLLALTLFGTRVDIMRVSIPSTEYMSTNEDSDIRVAADIDASTGRQRLLLENHTNPIVIAADDPVITFEVRLLSG